MSSGRRLFVSLFFIVGCAQEGSEQKRPTSEALAQVAAVGSRDWTSIGGTATSGPALCSWGEGRLDVFARGADNAVWHRTWDSDAWSEWESLGSSITADPACVSWGPGRIDVFVRGRDNALHRRYFDDGEWSSRWESLGGSLQSSPAVTSWGPGRLDVFARGGTGGTLWQKSYETGWTDWRSVEGSFRLSSDPSAVSWGRGRIDVIARGDSGDFHQITYDGGRWGRWSSLGNNVTSVRRQASWSSWLTGNNQNWWQSWASIPRSPEEAIIRWILGSALASNELTPAPGLTSQGPGKLDLFATASDGTLYQRSFQNGRWGELVSLGGPITSAADAISWGDGQIDVVARGGDNSIVYKYYDDGSW